MKTGFKVLFILIILIIIFTPSHGLKKLEFSVYRVIIDPGHGGEAKKPMSKHGDRYDTISRAFLDNFREGAARRKIKEHIITYDIAEKVVKLLEHCSLNGNFSKFYNILKKYTDREPARIYIITKKSRGKSLTEDEKKNLTDPNAGYRLFDYPDKKGIIQPGRISKINAFKPHIVMSLHLAGYASPRFKGMSPVIAAPYSFFYEGLNYLKKIKKSRSFFYKNPLKNWFHSSNHGKPFLWFLNDVSFYFTNYELDKKLKPMDKLKGYRYNMIKWRYSDRPGWEEDAKKHLPKTKYSKNYKDFKIKGKFWEREKSKYEDYRRNKGYEGYGGDNAYASYEIIRYILYSLKLHGLNHRKQVAGKPYVGVWIIPIHVNAINPFIELGYLRRIRDRYLLTKKQNEIAEGIAVGIYSLLTGLELKPGKYKYKPRGKKIDLLKYNITNEKSYFDIVVE